MPVLLEPALNARIVTRDGPDGYRFAHDLFREELIAELDPARRARTHLAVARTLEDVGRPAELAWHYAQALPFGPVGPAVGHAVRAAESARAAGVRGGGPLVAAGRTADRPARPRTAPAACRPGGGRTVRRVEGRGRA
ncbi:hypothetical protein O1L60_37045 [Streptomyces diastatochromogenes]|nr:hypothetical protein [Streptomyces diastatochromogenes]